MVVIYDRQDRLEIEFCWVLFHSLLSLVLLPLHFDWLVCVSAVVLRNGETQMCDYGSDDGHSRDN